MYYLCTKFIKAINNVNLKQLTMSQLEKYLEAFKNLETTLTATEYGWELRIKRQSLWSNEMVTQIMTFDPDGKDLFDYTKPYSIL